MDQEFVEKRFSDKVDLGTCLVGPDLNVLMLRGFAPLDRLAIVSDADVFDQATNPNGTQRNLKIEHARDCLKYALESMQIDAGEKPMVFPEILLNSRDLTVLELYDPHDKEQLINLDSYSEPEEFAHKLVGVRVALSGYKWPKPNRAPFISRVDGNHRLYGTDEVLDKAATDGTPLEDEFPTVPFGLFIGLSQTEEVNRPGFFGGRLV